ncbi:uncharacterized protein LOC135828195 [Sycon ciliatum]|uniref:uncharacterized protein LOC135828195 n=1 Tax=Sycon ciliatum TaxID=27933 RepID=UPI0031F69BD1
MLQITARDSPKKKKRGHILSHIFRRQGSVSDSSWTVITSCDGNGIQEGDRIIEVDCTPVTNMTSDEVREMIVSKSKSAMCVQLTVERRSKQTRSASSASFRMVGSRTSTDKNNPATSPLDGKPNYNPSPVAALSHKRSDPMVDHHRMNQDVDTLPPLLPLGSSPSLPLAPATASNSLEAASTRKAPGATGNELRKCRSMVGGFPQVEHRGGRHGDADDAFETVATATTSVSSRTQRNRSGAFTTINAGGGAGAGAGAGGTARGDPSADSPTSHNPSLDANTATRKSTAGTDSVSDYDDDYDEEEDDIPPSGPGDLATMSSRLSQASVQLVTRLCKGERARRSTLPGRVFSAEKAAVSVANSVLCRGETFTERHRSSRSVFRTKDLEIGEVLGQGFFGRAVRVVNKENGEVMVMKELMKCTAEARQNFLQEVQMMKALDHVNVMSLLGIMYRGRNLCIITEYIGGGTLSERIMDKERDLSNNLKVHFACDIAAGMAYLHANKIIHRDLTSNNCMIRTDDSVVVGDFGLAKVLAGKDPNQSQVVGSAYWMAPEMMRGKGYDYRADIFSFGIITCELIGRISADPDEMPRTMEFGLDDKAFRSQFLGQFPAQVFDVPVMCCQLDPMARPLFPTIEAYLNALTTAIENGAIFRQPFDAFVKAYESVVS